MNILLTGGALTLVITAILWAALGSHAIARVQLRWPTSSVF